MTAERKIVKIEGFIKSNFGYCPIVSILRSPDLHNKINYLYEKVLRITYESKSLHFKTY